MPEAMAEIFYIGNELDLFRDAKNWKAYFESLLWPWIRGRVLEVRAGIGTMTAVLKNELVTEWICLEPDPELARLVASTLSTQVIVGMVDDLADPTRFDCILYI